MSASTKRTALLIGPFPYNHSISDISAGLNNSRQRDFVKLKGKISIFIENLTRVPLKLEKPEKLKKLFPRFRQLYYGCMVTTLFYTILFCKTIDLPNKNDL